MKRDIDEELVLALHARPSLEQIKAIVKRGANVNVCDVKDDSGIGTMLMHAVWDGYMSHEIIKFLIECGADVNATDTGGVTVLMRALDGLNPREDVICCLIEHGAEINAEDDSGTPVLWYAISGLPDVSMKIVKDLIRRGAVMEYWDKKYLFYAVMGFSPETVAFLLEQGADPNIIIDEETAELLQEHGRPPNVAVDGVHTVLDWVDNIMRANVVAPLTDSYREDGLQWNRERGVKLVKLLVQAGGKRMYELGKC